MYLPTQILIDPYRFALVGNSRAIQVFQQLLYTNPAFKRASEVHLRLALMFKVLKQYDTSLKHFKLTLADSSPCISPQPEIRLHRAHLYEVQGKYKQAKEAYETFIQRDQLTPALKAAGLRQLAYAIEMGFPVVQNPTTHHCTSSVIEVTVLISSAARWAVLSSMGIVLSVALHVVYSHGAFD
ncbi:lysine-specific demethylase 6A-like [Elysia marginata]|uniref:Lysine-specific demethylase 6A-like n=1 Tax=Elysia marginata TaxID=1093978 RepID=A0AAV4H9X0_9GAST|nr:lysine-specific demethylase 6A-like [Elysia marginata]